MVQVYLDKKPFIAVTVLTLCVMATTLIGGLLIHAGAFALGCTCMFLLSSIRVNGQSIIGGTDHGAD